MSGNDRFFFRVSGNTFLEPVSDWTYEVPAFEGLHSIDRSRYNWAVIGNWTHVAGKTLIDTQVASNRFFQDDLLRLHEYKPTDMGLPGYLDAFCAAQNDCMLPAVTIGGYQGISQGAVSGDTTTNLQGTVNVTQVRGRAHAARGRRCSTRAAPARSGRQPLRAALVHQRVHPAGQRHVAAHAEQPRAEPGGVHAGHSVDVVGDHSADESTFATTSSPPTGRIRGV